MVPHNAITVEEIINGFPNPVLPKINHEPTCEYIQVIAHLLNANYISVPSMMGGGAHVQLGIIMIQVEYAAISATPWVEPFNPGAITIIPAGTNAVDAAQIARMHDEFRCIYTNRIHVDQALNTIMLELYNNMYTYQLEDYLLQYTNLSALEVPINLKQTYGFINPTQLAENYNKMKAPINFQDPSETLFKHITDGVRYENAGMQPYMEAQYVNIYFLLILNTGAIPDACRDWQRRTPVNQTWDDFRREFARAQREQLIIYSTTSGAGYHTANAEEHYVQNPLPADEGFVTAMDNLVTIIYADPETVATLNKEIATLTEQPKAKDIWAKSQEAELNRLLGGRTTTAPTVPTTPGATYARKSYMLIPQVRLVHKYPISPWEMIHPPGGDNPVCM
jgi:hypothetical protein